MIIFIYLIVLVKKLLITVTHANKILEDLEVVSEIASERSQDVNNIITNVSGTVSDLSDAVKGNESTVSAIASIAKSAASIKGIISGDKDK